MSNEDNRRKKEVAGNRVVNKQENTEENSAFLRHIREQKEDTSGFAKTLLVLVIVVCSFVLGLIIFSEDEERVVKIFGEDSAIAKTLLSFSKNRENKQRASFAMPFMPRRTNVLLVGVDDNGSTINPWKGSRTDTIIILNIDPKTKSINAISVPRDSKVYLPANNGVQKINHAHAIGGIEMTKETLERTLGIKIDKYVMVHDLAVEKMVDAIGGIPIYVEKRMYYNDNAGDLHIDLNKGLNILTGKQAVGYLRFRKDGLGDIGRTQRQQWFLNGLIDRMKSPQTISKIPELLNVINDYVRTDMSFYEVSQYVAIAKNFDANKIEFSTLPGAPNQRGSISYWILDPEKTQDVINRMIYRDVPEVPTETLKVGILFSSSKSAEAEELKSKFEEAGYNVNCYVKTGLMHSQFVAHTPEVSNKAFNKIKSEMPYIKKIQFVYNPMNDYCLSSDFSIRLADD